MTDKEIQQLEDKKFLAHSKDRAKNTAEISKKLDEMKPLKEVSISNMPEMPKFPEELNIKLNGIELVTVKGEKGDKGDTGEKGEKGDTGKEGKKGKDGKDGKDGHDGQDGKDGLDGSDGLNGIDGKDGSPDTAEQIIEKLQTLKEAWLEVKSIKGLDKMLSDMGTNFLQQARGFVPNALASLYDVDMRNVSDQQSVIWDAAKKKFVPGSPAGSGTGFTKLTATGTVDGANTAFTFTQKPTYVVSDGAWYVENSGWTWNAGTLTATLSVPPQTGIWGFV